MTNYEQRKQRARRRDRINQQAEKMREHIASSDINPLGEPEQLWPEWSKRLVRRFKFGLRPIRCQCGAILAPIPARCLGKMEGVPHYMCPFCDLVQLVDLVLKLEDHAQTEPAPAEHRKPRAKTAV